jgi:hypothetical protein
MFLDEEFFFSEQFESVKVLELRIVLYVEIFFPLIVFSENSRRRLVGLCQVVHTIKDKTQNNSRGNRLQRHSLDINFVYIDQLK